MAEIYTLVAYNYMELSMRVFDTLDEAKQVMSKEYSEVLTDIHEAIKLYPKDRRFKRHKKYFSEEYASLYVENEINAKWKIFTIQV